jgi:hypothetical protein
MTITGNVSDVRSRWAANGTRIITEATVHTDQGVDIVVSQFGGKVDGLRMREFPGPEPLVDGMRVTVAATPSLDLSARMHVVVDGVKVLAAPPNYVRTGPTDAGNYLYWESGCVFITPDAAGTKEIAGDAEFTAITQSIAQWNTAIKGCSYMQLMEETPRDVETGRDMVNIIKFRDTSWCRPASGDDPARCHPQSAAGITTATYVDDSSSDRDGAIVDADIELNGVDFAIGLGGQTLGQESCLSELKNTLTHELGHLLGLEHTCLAQGDPPRVDDKGNPVPSCNQAMQGNVTVILEATMFNYQNCGERSKESLEADDIAAACGIYPSAEDPGTCEPVGEPGGCCNTGGTGQPVGSALIGLLVFARFWRRRR